VDEQNPYTDYQFPIGEMQRMSAIGQPFQIEFRKRDGSKRIIKKAILRGQSQVENDRNGPYKIQFFDTQNEQMGSCFIPLITALNDRKIIIHGNRS
jgi:hypothetical protein